MKEIVNMVKEKAGISEDQARTAVQTVANFIKGRLPKQVADQIDPILEGKDVSSIGQNLGNMFGGGDKK
jgi:nucleoid DNA-binding protein